MINKITPDGTVSIFVNLDGNLSTPNNIAFDTNGYLYSANGGGNNRLLKTSPDGSSTTLFANASNPHGLAIDSSNNVYLVESTNNVGSLFNDVIFKFDRASGIKTTFCNIGSLSFGITIDTEQYVYFSQNNEIIFKTKNGAQWTFIAQNIPNPQELALGPGENYLYATSANNIILQIDTNGSGTFTDLGVNPAYCDAPRGIVCDASGNLYWANAVQNGFISKRTSDGIVSRYVSTPIYAPEGIAADISGNLYCANNNRINKIAPDGTVTTFIATMVGTNVVAFNTSGTVGYTNSNNIIKQFQLNGSTSTFYVAGGAINGMALDASGHVYCSLADDNTIVKIASNGASSSTFASNVGIPVGLAFGADGYLYSADASNNVVYSIAPDGSNKTTFATLSETPAQLAFGAHGILYYTSSLSGRIVSISSDGATLTDVVTENLSIPSGIVARNNGNNTTLYTANQGNNAITQTVINTATTVITVSPSSYTVTNGVAPFSPNVTSTSPAAYSYSSDNPDVATANSSGITIRGSSPIPVLIRIHQEAIPGYSAATATVSIQANAASPSNPTPVRSALELKYILSQSTSSYCELTGNIDDLTHPLLSNLAGDTSKSIINGTDDFVSISMA